MSRTSRRDPQVVDTVTLQQDDTPQYAPVKRDGTLAGANEDILGFTMSTGDTGDPVPVCRLGFCPVIGATAANISDKTELAVAANNQVDAVPTSGGGTAWVVAVAEENLSADGAQVGAWVDCLSAGRDETIPA